MCQNCFETFFNQVIFFIIIAESWWLWLWLGSFPMLNFVCILGYCRSWRGVLSRSPSPWCWPLPLKRRGEGDDRKRDGESSTVGGSSCSGRTSAPRPSTQSSSPPTTPPPSAPTTKNAKVSNCELEHSKLNKTLSPKVSSLFNPHYNMSSRYQAMIIIIHNVHYH